MTLAASLREATRSRHAESERSGVMAALLRGELALPTYCALLRSLHLIYAALEPALARHASDPWLAPLHEPLLWRAAALVADLDALHGPGWAASVDPCEPALDYASHLARLADEAPGLLVAHAYTRYLGDLSGGQILRRVVAAAYGLRDDAGLAFYRFAPPGAAALAQRFREGLQALPQDPTMTALIADEACSAFDRHVRLFGALARQA